jgi:ArsR family metal-binding transcriptional regulator
MAGTPTDTRVQLGCGTLIIIAIIVALFSGGRSDSRQRRQLEEMNERLDRLEQKIDELSRKLGQAPRIERETPSSPR